MLKREAMAKPFILEDLQIMDRNFILGICFKLFPGEMAQIQDRVNEVKVRTSKPAPI